MYVYVGCDARMPFSECAKWPHQPMEYVNRNNVDVTSIYHEATATTRRRKDRARVGRVSDCQRVTGINDVDYQQDKKSQQGTVEYVIQTNRPNILWY